MVSLGAAGLALPARSALTCEAIFTGNAACSMPTGLTGTKVYQALTDEHTQDDNLKF